jgi:hypothetical protein
LIRTIAALALNALILAGCGPRAAPYPPEFELNFITACQAGAPPAGYCDCVWGKIKTEIPVEDFIGFDAAMQASQPHPVRSRIEGFMRQCTANSRG